jgi:hypothetical protein
MNSTLMMKPLLFGLVAVLPAAAALRDVQVIERADMLAGKSFGAVGAYERIVAKGHFTVDPRLPANRIITDLRYARLTPKAWWNSPPTSIS